MNEETFADICTSYI